MHHAINWKADATDAQKARVSTVTCYQNDEVKDSYDTTIWGTDLRAFALKMHKTCSTVTVKSWKGEVYTLGTPAQSARELSGMMAACFR